MFRYGLEKGKKREIFFLKYGLAFPKKMIETERCHTGKIRYSVVFSDMTVKTSENNHVWKGKVWEKR